MAHKIREALASDANGATVSGEVEVDGAYIGGHVGPANRRVDRKDRRLAENQTGKRRVVVIMRERGGRRLPFVFKSEDASLVTIARNVAPGSTVYADEAMHWDALHARFLTKRINHSEAYSTDESQESLVALIQGALVSLPKSPKRSCPVSEDRNANWLTLRPEKLAACATAHVQQPWA